MDKELEKLIYSPNTTGKDINDYFYRIDKEESFLSLIKDYIIKEDKEKYPNSIFYFNSEGKVLFQLNKKYSELYCNYSLVWKIFYERYGMDYNEIESFIKDQVDKHFKLKSVTPEVLGTCITHWMEKHFKK